jgi:MFS family permease
MAGSDHPSQEPTLQTPRAISPWSPFRYRVFAVIWTATVIANIGTWMYSAASAWLMTSLNADPLIVSMVQVVTGLPLFLFAVPAGALADIVDKRRFLIIGETATSLLGVALAALVSLDLVTPSVLLLFTFLVGVWVAFTAPAWQAIVPQLVPRPVLEPAVAANSVGVNISRAIGPALGGALIVMLGIAAPFWFNGLSNVATVAALLWWRTGHHEAPRLPAERFMSAIRTGFRFAHHNPHLRSSLLRAVAFFLFASAYWALLPLVARTQIAGGPELYGLLLGAIGLGAVAGAFGLRRAKAAMGPDGVVATGTAATAFAMALFGLATSPLTAFVASIIAGGSWIAVLSSLNVSVQVALPDWVRGRGLALFVAVFYGATTLGSLIWGEIARMTSLPIAHYIAAFGALTSIPLVWGWKLQTGAALDLAPSMHWPAPILERAIEEDQGPVLVSVEYRVSPNTP